MKAYFNNLSTILKQKDYLSYIISGDEPWQKEKALKIIINYLTKKGFENKEYQYCDKSLDSEWFYQRSDNFSLFSEKQLLVIRFTQMPDEKSKKLITEFANDQHDSLDTRLILILPQLNSKQQKQKWYQALDNSGLTLPIWPFNRSQMQTMIYKLSTSYQIRLSNNATQRLIEQTEGNFLATDQTLQKLAISHKDQTITEDDISEIISTQSHYDIYALSDAFLQNNLKHMLLIINQLKESDTELVLLLWALSQDIRLLLTFKQAATTNELNQLFTQNRIWKNRQTLYLNALKCHSIERLKHKLSLCYQTDQLLKSYQTEAAWRQIVDVLLP
ncbi:DNA polymerase III subunit delta [Thiotrichales bacterium 19S9-12]|nr:DNA polymerase III subunit delta [Thiotrichales bacterium 19S9-11]MCF6812049.1 DNA polymerase III subunit delta [Thiotrichales bacterium 19S9-12]